MPGARFAEREYRVDDAGVSARRWGFQLLKGREMTEADGPGSEKVLLISESMARQSFAGVDPIGKQIMCGWDLTGEMVDDCGGGRRCAAGFAGGASRADDLYASGAACAGGAEMQVVVRTRADAGAMAETLRKMMKQRYPQVAVKATTMRENVGESGAGAALPHAAVWELCGGEHSAGDHRDVWGDGLYGGAEAV